MSNRRDECNRIEDEIINGQTMINLSVDLNTNTHTKRIKVKQMHMEGSR